LAGCVLAYDLGGKRTVLGPPLMGACRSLNVLLGMVCTRELRAPWDLPASWLGVAAGIGVYVAGITWFARQEAGISRRSHLLGATTVMACGILLLAGYAILDAADGSRALRWADPWIWPLLLLLLTVPVWRRCASAIGQPSAARIQAAVKHAILTLILLDAAICLATVGHFEALAVLSLSLPFLVLGHWIYST
jgi:4-hydroxybenzoate polyprenyltransferase